MNNTYYTKSSLNPVTDGPNLDMKKIHVKHEKALLVGSDGRMEIISRDRALAFMDELSGLLYGEYIGNSDFIGIFNSKCNLRVDDRRFYVGTVLIMKSTGVGLGSLSDEECEEAYEAYKEGMVTLVSDGHDFTAYEIS